MVPDKFECGVSLLHLHLHLIHLDFNEFDDVDLVERASTTVL